MRLRSNFKELIVKPLKLQMLIEFPELKDDEFFTNAVDITFFTNQVFEEWKKINNLEKKTGIVGTLLGVMNGEKPYFHIEWIMDNVFKLTPEEKAENAKYWAMDVANQATGEPGSPSDGGGGGFGGSGESGEMSGGQMASQSSPESPAQGGGQAAPQSSPEPPAEEGGSSEFEF
jgi:hypothetical protein